MIKVDGRWKHTSEELEKLKSQVSWCKGLTKETDARVKKQSESLKGHLSSELTKSKISSSRLKRKQRLGYLNSYATRQKISKSARGKVETVATRQKISEKLKGTRSGENHPMYGRHHTVKARRGMSEKLKGKRLGLDNPNWRGGKSFLPYSAEFTRQLKELIRQRDNYQCQKCGCSELENMEKLSVHHIDYDKKNCLPSNLTSLCRRCNALVNGGREFWERYFSTKLRVEE